MASQFGTSVRSIDLERLLSRWWEASNEKYEVAFFIALVSIAWFHILMRSRQKGEVAHLPPGPRGLPLVGNLPFIDPELHSHLAKLSETYGPIMKLQLGRKTSVIISSPSTAKEILKDQDAIFANRDIPIVGRVVSYGVQGIVWSPNSPSQTWRMLRRICVREMFSKKTLDSLYDLRRREVRKTISYINTKAETPVDIGELGFGTMLNLILTMLWGGMPKSDEESTSFNAEFREAVSALAVIFAKPNISDFFPFLSWFDLQGAERGAKRTMVWFDRLFDSIINERLNKDTTGTEGQDKNKEHSDLLQLLLQLKEEGDPKTPLTMKNIKALLFDIVAAGTETSSSSLEWAMAELMEHPEMMRKAEEELEEVVGLNNIVEESHLPKLHYLRAILREVHRLHPVVPLLLPRSPSESCIVGGYEIPKGSQIMVNAWAIHRDPLIWDNPLKFQPERFLNPNEKFDYSGNDFRYFPFGSGRRMCIGVPMAERMLPYTLASIIHSFNWRSPKGTKVDLAEKFGIVLNKAIPLVLIPSPRLSHPNLYS